MTAKMGLTLDAQAAGEATNALFAMLTAAQSDFTLFFRALAGVLRGDDYQKILDLCQDPDPCAVWLDTWETLIAAQSRSRSDIASAMDKVNPAYIPRLHLVENALTQAGTGDMSAFEHLLAAMRAPFVSNPDFQEFETLSTPNQQVTQTFCET